MQLRPYQLEAVDRVREQFAAGVRRTLLVLATGLGKAVIAAEISRRAVAKGGRVLVIAHRAELLEQLADKLARAGVDAAIEQGARTAGHAPVVVASVQSLQRKRLARFARDEFSLVIPDEAHHTPSTSWRTILGTFDAHVLGLTATPDRLDGQALGDVFESVAYRYELREAIRDGWLAPLIARRVTLDAVDLSSVSVRGGDLAPEELSRQLETERALHGAAAALLRESGERRTIAFAASVAHAEGLARVLNGLSPGVATAVHGSLRADERARRLAAHRRGEVRILVNPNLLLEGYDDPAVACVALARPTKSRALYAQAVGRGTRLAPGKADLLVLDLAAGVVGRHRLAGPEDVLAGALVTDEQRLLLDQWLKAGGCDLESALVRAAREAEETARAEAASAEARYRVEELDPWITVAPVTADDGTPASAKQLAALKDAGVRARDGLTHAEADAVIAAVNARSGSGLCSVKSAKMLAARGVPRASELTKAEAAPLMAALRRTGWKYVPRHLVLAVRPEFGTAAATEGHAA